MEKHKITGNVAVYNNGDIVQLTDLVALNTQLESGWTLIEVNIQNQYLPVLGVLIPNGFSYKIENKLSKSRLPELGYKVPVYDVLVKLGEVDNIGCVEEVKSETERDSLLSDGWVLFGSCITDETTIFSLGKKRE